MEPLDGGSTPWWGKPLDGHTLAVMGTSRLPARINLSGGFCFGLAAVTGILLAADRLEEINEDFDIR